MRIRGPFGEGQEFDAILDSGFTGFVSMPLLSALPLGLILYGTASVELADGSKDTKLTAQGEVAIGEESEVGVVVLEPTSNDVLLGMAFLRIFKRALFVSQDMILLIDESRRPDPDPIPDAIFVKPDAPPPDDALPQEDSQSSDRPKISN